jgi:acylphosphatase
MTNQANKASLHAVVSGIVQGVCYRAFVVREAAKLGLRGAVRNLPDGRVETEAEGERQRLEQFVTRLHEGPPDARVTDVATEWSVCRDEYRDFRIDYD